MSYYSSARPNSGYTFPRGSNSHQSPTSPTFADHEGHSQLRSTVRAPIHPLEEHSQHRRALRQDTAFGQPTYASSPVPDPNRYVPRAPSWHEAPCDNCGLTHQCTRPVGSPSTSPKACYRCVSLSLACTTEHGSNYISQTPNKYPAQISGSAFATDPSSISGPRESYARDSRTCTFYPSRQTQEKHTARSTRSYSSTHSDTLASATASSPASPSNGSSATKDAFEPVKKRTQVRGYIPTLDARLSRLESMLGELIPSASQVLKPSEVQVMLSKEEGSGNCPPVHPRLSSSSSATYGRDNSRPSYRGSELSIPEDPLLDGALEDALLARRPVDQEERAIGNKHERYPTSYSSCTNRRSQTTTAKLFLGPNQYHS